MKVAIVYWTGTGNTQQMAEAIADGVKNKNGEVEILTSAEFDRSRLDEFDAIAFGCPAMGAEELEEDEFEPMFADLEADLKDRKIALFGSYGWGSGEWMESWEERCAGNGANVIDTLIVNESPDDDGIADCEKLGEALAG